MAVCGRCWLCGEKFSCGRGFQCEGCAADQGVRGPVSVVESKYEEAHARQICRNCVELVDGGAVGALISALRVVKDTHG